MYKNLMAGLVFSLLFSQPLYAGYGGSLGPPSDLSKNEKYEWWLGGISKIANLCHYRKDSITLRKLAKMSPHGQDGLAAWQAPDGYAGNCAQIKPTIDQMIKNAPTTEKWLLEKYK